MAKEKHKLAYITGGSSGIGLAIARRLVQQGIGVYLFGRDPHKLESAVTQLRKECEGAFASGTKNDTGLSQNSSASEEFPPPIYQHPLDVSDPQQVYTCIPSCLAESGTPDFLINCAGIARPGYFEELAPEIFERTIKTNLLGTIHMARAVFPAMAQQGSGRIINVSSLAGLVGVFGYTAYGASKFGVIGFSETLRAEARRYGITVQVLCPPDTDTPQLAEENQYKPPETRRIAGNARLLSPDQVAQRVIAKLSSSSFYIFADTESALIYHLHRLFPRLVERIMDWQIKDVQKTKQAIPSKEK
ncbi:MAG TPA: SDR family oxidoreductase [Termitinemataceae bacterium]|nr:SDR family oxidoreductase [Termitinemataceae bacterium]HOM23142.1 SDR family oxidoreductase [Termitinemataceae bacterium]HPQ00335.1 SDR family oxidoreductase [Termitinemataceae bacterium]